MYASEYDQFVRAISTVAAVYGKTLDDQQVKFYWDALQDRPLADVENRIGRYAKKGKFFPKPRDLRPVEPDEEKIESNPAAEARYQDALGENERNWNARLTSDGSMARLLLCEALLARYDVERDQDDAKLTDKREALKHKVGELLQAADAKAVLANPTTWRLVLRLYNQRGIFRLEDRAKQAAA